MCFQSICSQSQTVYRMVFRLAVFVVMTVVIGISIIGVGGRTVFADTADDQLNIALNYFRNQQYSVAAGNIEMFLSKYPTNPRKEEAQYYLAETYLNLRQYEKAATQFGAIMSDGKNPEYVKQALYRSGEVAFLAGQYDMAKPLLYDFLVKNPQDPLLVNVLPYLAKMALAKKQQGAEEAAHYFSQAIEMFPQGRFVNDCKYGLACAEVYLGQYDDAVPIFRYIATSPGNPLAEDAEFQLATLEFDRGSPTTAINQLNLFLQKYPNSAKKNDVYRCLAKANGELKQYSSAYQILMRVQPQTDEDTLLKVRLLYGQGEINQAQQLLRQLSQLQSAAALRDEIRYLQAVMASEQNDWQTAAATLERLLAVQFSQATQEMKIGYWTAPPPAGIAPSEKLMPDTMLNACSLLAISHARLGDTIRANAVLNEMNTLTPPGNVKQQTILSQTWQQVNQILAGNSTGNGNNYGNVNGTGNGNINGINGNGSGYWAATVGPGYGQQSQPSWNDSSMTTNDTAFQRPGSLAQNPSSGATATLVPIGTGSGNRNNGQNFSQNNGQNNGQNFNPNSGSSGFGSNTSTGLNFGQNSGLNGNQNSPTSSTGGQGVPDDTLTIAKERQLRDMFLEAKSAYNRKRYEETDGLLRDILDRSPPESLLLDTAILRIRTLRQMKNEKAAIEICEQIMQVYPGNPKLADVYWLSGLLYMTADKPYRATKNFQLLVDTFPNSDNVAGAYYYLAWDFLEAGDDREAKSYLTKIYTNYKESEYWSHAAWLLAMLTYRGGDVAKADKMVREILNHPPDIAILDRVLFLRGQLAMEMNRYDMATVAFQTLLQSCPRSQLCAKAEEFLSTAAASTIRR